MIATIQSALASCLGLILVSAFTLLCGVVLRNPFSPAWLRNDAAAQAITIALTTLILIALTQAIGGLLAANVPRVIIAVLVIVIPAATVLAIWKLFGVGERLRWAEAGQSPFGRAPPATGRVALAMPQD